MAEVILGLSAYYHDSAAALLINGELVGAIQEERFSRLKHDASFPRRSIDCLLKSNGIKTNEITNVVFYDKPFLKFERILQIAHDVAPWGTSQFIRSMPIWLNEKLFLKSTIRKELSHQHSLRAPVLFCEHHLSHAASAFYPSPFDEAVILTVDGVGEWATASMGVGQGNTIRQLKELHFPHSLGLLYSSFTYFLGFKVNSGEYKLMGLAPYGDTHATETKIFKSRILDHVIDCKADGSIVLNLKYFKYHYGLVMTNDALLEDLLGLRRRKPESALVQQHANLALAVQQITDGVMCQMARHAYAITQCKNLVMAGGVALNCVSNSAIAKQKIFDTIWVQPAAGDAGGAIGAAYAGWYIYQNHTRQSIKPDAMRGCFLGPEFSNDHVKSTLEKLDAVYTFVEKFDELALFTAEKLSLGNIIGWFQGKMEFGPRALGNRSILADPRNIEKQSALNATVKFREDFRPFAPAVLAEDAKQYFVIEGESPYMLFTFPLRGNEAYETQDFDISFSKRQERVNGPIPAATHVDYSARVQTVDEFRNPKFFSLLNAIKQVTGAGIVVNTSFNVRGEPIVCSPEEAYKSFMTTGLDFLVIGNFILEKKRQPDVSFSKMKEWSSCSED